MNYYYYEDGEWYFYDYDNYVCFNNITGNTPNGLEFYDDFDDTAFGLEDMVLEKISSSAPVEVGRDNTASAFVPGRHKTEEQLCTFRAVRDIAHFIHHNEVLFQPLFFQLEQPVLLLGHLQVGYQAGRVPVAHPVTLPAGKRGFCPSIF